MILESCWNGTINKRYLYEIWFSELTYVEFSSKDSIKSVWPYSGYKKITGQRRLKPSAQTLTTFWLGLIGFSIRSKSCFSFSWVLIPFFLNKTSTILFIWRIFFVLFRINNLYQLERLIFGLGFLALQGLFLSLFFLERFLYASSSFRYIDTRQYNNYYNN